MRTLSRRYLAVALATAFALCAAVAVALIGAGPPLAAGGRMPETPAISGRWVVWADRSGGSFDIMLMDSASGVTRAIASSAADEIQPAIYGDRVVYVSYAAGTADIHLFDIPSGTTRVVCAAANDQVNPSVWGDLVVWEDYRTGYSPGVYGFDISLGAEVWIDSGYNRPKRRPQVAGDLVVWEDYSGQAGGRGDADVRIWNRVSGVKTTIAGTSVNEMLPSTDGRYVVWAAAAGDSLDLRAWDSATGETFDVFTGPGEQTLPTVGGGVAYWIDNSAGERLHIDGFSLSDRKPVVFDSRGVGPMSGVEAQGDAVVWLERNAGRWQVRAYPGAGPSLTFASYMSPAKVWSPLRLRMASVRDRVPPRFVAASVPTGATRVRADSFTLTFSESLDPTTAERGVSLADAAGKPVSAEVTYSARERAVRLKPKVALAGGTYAIRISPALRDRAGNPLGEVEPITFSTGLEVLDVAPPSAPSRPFARVDGLSSVTVTWNAARDDQSGVTTYTVWRSRTVTAPPMQVATVPFSVTSATFAKGTTETLPAKYTYYYTIRAIDASGNVSAASPMSSPDPHGTYLSGYNIANCTNCHTPHGAAQSLSLGAKSAQSCYRCHGATAGTAAFGWGSTYDSQGGFGDDTVVATTGPSVSGTRWVHRNAYMASIQRECDACHTPHRRPATTGVDPNPANAFNLLLRTQITTPAVTYRYNSYSNPVGNQVCFDCHGSASDSAATLIAIVGGSGAYVNSGGDHRTGWTPSLNLHADVSRVPSTSSNPGIQCTACHDNHASRVPRLLGTYDATAAVSRIGARTLTGNNATVCYGCHSGALTAYSRNASGYPLTGRWPGEATYAVVYSPADHTGSLHGTSTANMIWPSSGLATGDCKNCHVMHGPSNSLDILRGGTTTTPNYSAGTFAFCFTCHDGSPAADDIRRYYPVAAGGTAVQSAFGGASSPGTRFGHRTLSPGSLAAGSALPCYECHNPHGTASPYGLKVVTRTRGATITIGDSTGEITVTGTPTPTSVRRFCFSCHGSAESTSTWAWNGSTMVTLQAGDVHLGISRTAYDANGAHLKIPPVSGHYNADTQSCYGCHGSDYTGATTNNVHNPSPGGSSGGSACYSCHTAFRETMDMAGTQKTNAYHHVLGTSTVAYTGDMAPGAGTYPTSNQDVFCVSCHTDHNYFNGSSPTSPAANLRIAITNTSGALATNTDFIGSGSFGICVSCHSTARTKDLTNQRSDGRNGVAAISGSVFTTSTHSYNATSTFGSSTFRANCVKCHDSDSPTEQFQSSANKFSTHLSPERRLLSALGGTMVDPLLEQSCFRCHNGTTTDHYGVAAMSVADRATQVVFSRASTHPVSGNASGSRVACVNCHNPHEVSNASKISSPTNTYLPAAWATKDDRTQFCMSCHNGTVPSAWSVSPSLVPTPVVIGAAKTAISNKSPNQARSHWIPNGSISAGEIQTCDDCHDKHGSAAPKLLGTYQAASNVNTIGALTITANDNRVCQACHNVASTGFPAQAHPSLTASFYPTDGAWPGFATWIARGIHNTSTVNVRWPDFSPNPYVSGDCKQCHDVHGTANPLDDLRGTPSTSTFTNTSFTFCFTCHDGSPSTLDIRAKYPTSVGGSSTDPRSGHRTVSTTGTVFAGGSPIPCYACHNPHGSGETTYGLQVITQYNGTTVTVGDGVGELNVGTAQGVRNFCFSCHTTASGNSGWNGSAMQSVTAGDRALGFSRFTQSAVGQAVGPKLRLPNVNGHYHYDTTQDCLQCHADPHQPTGGISNGGSNCYSCHTAFRETMDMAGTQKTNAYHHVLGTSTVAYTGDMAPGAGTYPTSNQDVFCVSCHTDHNYFNGSSPTSPAANLRIAITNTSGALATNTDFIGSGSFGICVSCHSTARTKDLTNQRSDGRNGVAAISGSVFTTSTHSYNATSTFGSSTFRANCVKCHDSDSPTEQFQSSANKFSTHLSPERRLLSALGGTMVDPLLEQSCFRCHNGTTTDHYGVAAMSVADRATQVVFSRASTHPVSGNASGSRVACVNCHNPHEVSNASKISSPTNTYLPAAWATKDDRTQFCMSCHNGTVPSAWSVSPSLVPTPVVIGAAKTAISNKSPNQARSHWIPNGSISAGEIQTCDDCHDKHGSAAPKLLGTYQAASNVNTIGALTITANDNRVCQACHNVASTGFPAQAHPSLTASFYPTDGAWPGFATWIARGIHNTSTVNVRWPDFSPNPYVSGDCKQCHDVHGTANPLDDLRGTPSTSTFTNTSFTFCFTCHDGSPSTLDIRAKYPTSVGGSSTDPRSGHRTVSTTGTVFAGGSPIPCYACHNPHGSGETTYGLQVITQYNGTTVTVGDGVGELNVGTAQGVRNFCFSCHTTASGNSGWNGSAMQSVTAGDRALGFSRFTQSAVGQAVGPKLRLPNVNGHYHYDTTQSCLGCHADVHQPTGGGSNGTLPCYGCHPYQAMNTGQTGFFHHVLDGSPPDAAPGTGAYPTSTSVLQCVSCHVDHNYFNANPAANLRFSIGAQPSAGGTNTDFIASGSPSYGICLSCHSSNMPRDNVNQRAGGGPIVFGISPQDYAASAHNYSVPGTLAAGQPNFRANCSKCHDDENTGSKAIGPDRFGLHFSAEATLLAGMGVSINATGTSYPTLCYRCHGFGNPNAVKRRDYYDSQPLTWPASRVESDFARPYRHPIGRERHSAQENTAAGWNVGATRHASCMDCHNVHATRSGTSTLPEFHSVRPTDTAVPLGGALYGVWGVTISGSVNGTWTGSGTTITPAFPTYSKVETISYQWQLCLKCHSRYAWSTAATPLVSLSTANQSGAGAMGGGQQTDVGRDFNPSMTSYHPVFARGWNQPPVNANTNWNASAGRRRIGTAEINNGLSNTFTNGWQAASLVTCTDCHAPHGSSSRWQLRGKDTAVKVTIAGGSVNLPNNNTNTNASNFCVNCHRADVYVNGATYINLSRFNHSGCNRVLDANTVNWGMAHLMNIGCYQCHGARPRTGWPSSGALHGTNREASPTAQWTAAGYRMMNGAVWGASHRYEDVGASLPDGAANCVTQQNTSTYATCIEHNPTNPRGSDGVNYYYSRRR